MAKPDLRIVEPSALTEGKPAAPETRLRALFRREARLEAELLAARRVIQAERSRYAAKHNLLMLPGVAKLREIFG